MNHNFYLLFTVHFLIAAPLCTAMENTLPTAQAKIITTLTGITRPKSVVCLSDKTIALLSHEGCSIRDFFTDKEIINFPITSPRDLYITAHHNRKTLALCHGKIVDIYDVATKEKISKTDLQEWKVAPIFNSGINDTILVGTDKHIHSIKYKNNSRTSHLLNFLSVTKTMEFHPTKQEFAVLTNRNDVAILQLDTDLFCKKSIGYNEFCWNHKYSPDGSLIAVNNASVDAIVNPETGTHDFLVHSRNRGYNNGMAFDPTSFILAVLYGDYRDLIYFWNVQKNQLITIIRFPASPERPYNEALSYKYNQYLAFSCNGKELIVVHHDKTLVIETPFEVRFQPETKDKAISALYGLQQYRHDTNMLPQELIDLLIQTFLKTSQYSLTNY